MILSRDLDLGKIFSTQFAPDADVAMRVAVAGSTGSIKVWDLSTSNAARKAFGIASRSNERVEEGKVVGVVEDKDDEEEDEQEEWENMDDN
jgi:periodic tryptophan protein 1